VYSVPVRLAAGLVFIAAFLLTAPVWSSTQASGAVAGRVTDRAGRGLPGATVSARPIGAVRRNHVVVTRREATEFNATLDVSVLCECIEPPANAPRRGLYIGHVADRLGHGLPFALITVDRTRLTGPERGYADAAGNYTVSLPANIYSFSFSYPGFQTLNRKDMPVFRGWSNRLNVRLEPARGAAGAADDELLRIGCLCPGNFFQRPVRE
jgi:Carboxypeptidase regulatory-like domain